MIKSVVSPTQPLLPVAVYISSCKSESKGFLSFMGASDSAVGDGLCYVMWPTAKRLLLSDPGFVVLRAHKNSVNGNDFDIRPDLASEHAIGAKYRIIIGRPRSLRRMASIGGTYGSPPTARREWIETDVAFEVVKVASGKTLGIVNLKPNGSVDAMAKSVITRIKDGVQGPRCSAYHFNNWSIKSALQSIPKCTTFALPDHSTD